jgi:hypothetical protein
MSLSTAIPYTSPLRFHRINKPIDYVNIYPSFDMVYLREKYQRGIDPVNIYPNFAYGSSTKNNLQIEIFDTVNVTIARLRNVDTDATSGMSIANITPTGWVGSRVFRLSTNITTGGYYRVEAFTINNGWLYSDIFEATSFSDKNLIELVYSDSQNRNSAVYFDSTSQIWTPRVLYTGVLKVAGADFDRAEYTDEPNNTTVTRMTPKLKETLNITDIHHTYYSNICYQFSCDSVLINDVSYAVEEISEPQYKDDNADVIDVQIILSRNENNGFQQIL